jgi:S1-C subfamily serine protease
MGRDLPNDDQKPKSGEKSLGGPFEPPQEQNAIGKFAQAINSPGIADCATVYKSNKTAADLDAVTFDSCYHGKTGRNGRSLELKTPVMQPGKDGIPRPQIEKLTTEGITMDSRRLDVFVHALPAVRPVFFENGALKSAGTAAMVSSDGLMVTNKHVVDGSTGVLKVKMLNSDGTEELRNAHVVKLNPKQDLALLQVERKPGETFAALPLSKRTDWREREPLVEMGNANGEGKISMAKARYGKMVNQDEIPFQQQPPDVLQGRTMFQMDATVPQGYSGGVVLSIPGSQRTANGVERTGTSAIRGITDYSNLTNSSYIIPAARVQFMLDEYRKEQSAKAQKK